MERRAFLKAVVAGIPLFRFVEPEAVLTLASLADQCSFTFGEATLEAKKTFPSWIPEIGDVIRLVLPSLESIGKQMVERILPLVRDPYSNIADIDRLSIDSVEHEVIDVTTHHDLLPEMAVLDLGNVEFTLCPDDSPCDVSARITGAPVEKNGEFVFTAVVRRVAYRPHEIVNNPDGPFTMIAEVKSISGPKVSGIRDDVFENQTDLEDVTFEIDDQEFEDGIIEDENEDQA